MKRPPPNGDRAYNFPGLDAELYDYVYDGYDLPQEQPYTPLPDDDYGCDL